MSEKLATRHPLFDSVSLYGQMRATVHPEGKMRGYFHWLWARVRLEAESWPAVKIRSSEELTRSAHWLSGLAATGRNGDELPFRVMDLWPAQATLIGSDPTLPARLPRGDIELCLVREADGKQTLGCRAPLFVTGWGSGSRCRAFLFEPEVVGRLRGLMGETPWEAAFLADNVAIFEISQILAAAPEMEGIVGREDIAFDRVPVPEKFPTLPPRREPLQVVLVADTPVDEAVNG